MVDPISKFANDQRQVRQRYGARELDKGLDMNGCSYCVIIHNRKRRGRRLARGVAMCLAQREMTRCEQKSDERGPGCPWHDARVHSQNHRTYVSQHAATVSG